MKRLLSLAALVALLSGCASVGVDTQGPTTVVVQNTGCFLFCVMPLWSGDPDYPNQQVCNWFDNTVKLETNMRLLQETAAEKHARGIRNIVSHMDSEDILWFILKRKIYRTSAELVMD